MNPPIIHRDIKPENVLLDENNDIKLTDFGWSNYIHDYCDLRSTFCGTPIYLAPEIIMHSGHDEHVDIWCIGVMMFELIVGRPPFVGKDRDSLMKNIVKMRISWPKSIDADAKNLIAKILKNNPKDRISLVEIVKHPFISKYYPNSESCLIQETFNRPFEPFLVSKGITAKISTYSKDLKTRYVKKNPNGMHKPKGREVSPLPMSKLHLEKIEIIKAGKPNFHVKNQTNNEIENKNKQLMDSSKNREKNLRKMRNVKTEESNNFFEAIKKREENEAKEIRDSKQSKNNKDSNQAKQDKEVKDIKPTIENTETKENQESVKNSTKSSSISKHSKKKNSLTLELEKLKNENKELVNLNNQLKNEVKEFKDKYNEVFKLMKKIEEEKKKLAEESEIERKQLIEKIKSLENEKKREDSKRKEDSKKEEETKREEDKKRDLKANTFTQIPIPRVYSNNNYGRLTPQKNIRSRNIIYIKNELNKSFDNDHRNLVISRKNNEKEEIERLKKELKSTKEKYDIDIGKLTIINGRLKDEINNCSNSQNAKFKKLQDCLDYTKKRYEEELKKCKSKIRDLEQQIGNLKFNKK